MSQSKRDFIKQAQERYKAGSDAITPQLNREIAALRFYAGEQWDADLLKARGATTVGGGNLGSPQTVPARPSLTINKTREPVREILNQERQSEMAIELVPADDWGNTNGPIDHHEIELREGLVRRIQRDSEAADARTWAFERGVIAGRGFWLVNTRYLPGKTSDQEIYIHRIYNQGSVVPDPTHEQPDGSDMEWVQMGTDVPQDRYNAEYPTRNGKKNRVAYASDTVWRTIAEEAPTWFTSEGEMRSIRVVDYWYKERTTRTLAMFEDGSSAWMDELPDEGDIPPHTTRDVVEIKVKYCKIDGCTDDVLEETDWPSPYLPIIKYVAEELQPYDKERRCEGVVQPMMDPCRGNNYILSKFVERVGLTPIPPIMMAGGQDEGYEAEYDAINTRALSRVHYNQTDLDKRPAPPPFRIDARAEISDLAAGVQWFNDAIVSTSRVPETALGHVDPSVKSGKLAKALIAQAAESTSNYIDNLKRSMRHEARVINSLLYPIYGNRIGRMVRMTDASGKGQQALIGQPFTMGGPQGQQQPQIVPEGTPDARLMKLTPDCDFNVAVKVSKASETRRTQIFDMLTSFISAAPEQMQIIGDLVWKYADAPEHEELEKRYRAVLAPPVAAVVNGQPNIPPEMQQKVAMLEAQNQQLMQLADKNKTDLLKAQMQQQGEDARNRENNETKLAVAELGAKVDRLALFLEERARLGVQEHELAQSQLDHFEDMEQQRMAHAQALQQGQQQVEGQSALAGQQAMHAQDAAVQQAALQPAQEQ